MLAQTRLRRWSEIFCMCKQTTLNINIWAYLYLKAGYTVEDYSLY
jgi:hypothetical protein